MVTAIGAFTADAVEQEATAVDGTGKFASDGRTKVAHDVNTLTRNHPSSV
jgi:hypothetical protein